METGCADNLQMDLIADSSISLSKNLSSTPCQFLDSEPRMAMEIEEAIPTEDAEQTPPNKKRSWKGKSATPLVESAVRISIRVQSRSKGFKSKSCQQNCPGCSSKPPILSAAALEKIGTNVCQLKEEDMEELTLMVKSSVEPIGKRSKKGNGDKKKNREDKKQDDHSPNEE